MTTPDLSRLGTVLTVWAHPDDETYLAGGLLAALRDAGHRVVCVTATRGEAADPGADDDARAALAQTRTEELETALGLLGVVEHHWLDLPDGGCAGLDPAPVVSRLSALVAEVRPDTVVTFGPDGFTGHPDHVAVSGWVDLALTGARPVLLHAVVVDGALPDPALDEQLGVFELGRPRTCATDDVVLDLTFTGADLDRKVAALVGQVSQTAGVLALAGEDRFAAWVARECFAEPAPVG